MSEIRTISMELDCLHFSRNHMKFAGETMRDYTAGDVNEDGQQSVYVRKTASNGGAKRFLFNAETGRMNLKNYIPE